MILIVGDSLLQNPFEWKLNDNIQLSFHEDSVSDKDHSNLYSAKPEIIHQFRVDEKRPPTIVSLVFSGLTLLPLVILLISVRKRLVLLVNLIECFCVNSGLDLVLI